MKKIIYSLITFFNLILFTECIAGEVNNDWFSLEFPDNWIITPNSQTDENNALTFNLQSAHNDCVININIIPFQGKTSELAKQIREQMRANKIVIGEYEELDGIYFCKVKKGNLPGILYIGGNGQEVSMLTIFGSRKMIKQAQDLLKGIQVKTDLLIFPKTS